MVFSSRTCAASTALALVCGCGSETTPPGDTPDAAAEILRPAAGEVITIGTRQPIVWTPKDGVARVDVILEHPSGTRLEIATDIANSGSYDWQVPLLHETDPRAYSLSVVPTGSPSAEPTGQAASALESGEGVAIGSLAGFKWNGTSEEYYWVDLVTGESTIVGTVGDMRSWQYKGAAALDAPNGIVYVVASPDDVSQKLYALDAGSGALLSDVAISGPTPSAIQVTSQGELVGFTWNGSAEELLVVDSDTGDVSVRGTVGDLQFWQQEATIDNGADRVYVLGQGAAASVYTLDALTGALLDTQPLQGGSNNMTGLVTTSDGRLVAFRWNGSEEETIEIDPATGDITVLGTVGDLVSWSGYSAVNRTTDEVYVFGFDAGNSTKLYVVDATTGTLLYDLPVTDYPTSTLLVY